MPGRIKREVERIEIPQQHFQFASRRMKGFVEFAADLARFGTLDLVNLAASAYLQGLSDCLEAMERRGMALTIDRNESFQSGTSSSQD